MSNRSKCQLLSLPKELRLEIWKYVITDPSVPDLAVEISRAPLSPSKSSLRFPRPCLEAVLQPTRNVTIGLNLLLTNEFIYHEALPILYDSVKFAPLDLEGIFPLFLDTLSPFGRSLIRHVKLRIPSSIYDIDLFGDPSTCLFHWAVTCAQVAKVDNLRDVHVEGFEDHDSRRVRSGLLNPLVKLKAEKIFVPNDKGIAQMRLSEAEEDLVAKASTRKLRAGLERASRKDSIQDPPTFQHKDNAAADRQFTYLEFTKMFTPHSTIEGGLGAVAGLARFQKELEEHTQAVYSSDKPPEYGDWEVLSLGSDASTPHVQPTRSASIGSDDTASTLIDDFETSSWVTIDEVVEKQHKGD